MLILGINAYHGDSAACLVADGKLIAAIEEERIRRIKHWAGFPAEAIRYCLAAGGVRLDELDHVAIGRNPSAHLHKKVLFLLQKRPSFTAIRDRLSNMGKVLDLRGKLAQALDADPAGIKAQFHNVEHHRAHMASSFFLSPFDEAACMTIDGFGDFVSTMFGHGSDRQLECDDWVSFPHSLGLFYTACTQYIGFAHYGDEYKVMGLAPYGEPEYLDAFREILRLKPEGKFELDLDYFVHHSKGVEMQWEDGSPELGAVYSERWAQRFGPVRRKDEPLEARHHNLARSVQAMAEEVYFHALNRLAGSRPSPRLCLAGGCAYNSVANGKIFQRTPFTDLYIHPAAGDAGTAVGAAYWVWHQELGMPRGEPLAHAYLGPEYAPGEVRRLVEASGLPYEWLEDEGALVERTVERIVAGDVVGWFQGRSEWGPRALGNRSIVVDPRRPDMKDILNERIKRRENFRPFAPSILEERTADYFEESYPVPFMLQVYPIRPERRAEIPAVTHVDGSGRLQTVSRQSNPRYHRLIEAFGRRTGVPVLLNTSFNENEPIVNHPDQAIDCFRRTRMDTLVLGNAFLRK
ncbi:MAG TPA: carbamoyltransferase C-terminal domain-containing protein [Candidatus Polarisedimenticolaceae bacterium]|nr:carbamoyltransferase C-terminal domain-containing protein [Candidatus Polarisedimenticolaceae bacterium]